MIVLDDLRFVKEVVKVHKILGSNIFYHVRKSIEGVAPDSLNRDGIAIARDKRQKLHRYR